MDRKIVREIGRHTCVDDDGNRYVVIEYREFLITHAMGQPPAELEGQKFFRLRSGDRLEVVGDGTFKILETDVIVREI